MSHGPSPLQQAVLRHLHEREGVELAQTVANLMGDILHGESVTTKYRVEDDGRRVPVSETRKRTPASMARGLVLADVLTGGELGIVKHRQQLVGDERAEDELYLRFAGQLDTGIIQQPAGEAPHFQDDSQDGNGANGG